MNWVKASEVSCCSGKLPVSGIINIKVIEIQYRPHAFGFTAMVIYNIITSAV